MIKKEEVEYIAKLSKLRFTEDETEKMASELEAVLQHFHSIDKLDLEDVDLNKYSNDTESVLRKDLPADYADKEKLFSNVKSKRNTYIEVPKIIE